MGLRVYGLWFIVWLERVGKWYGDVTGMRWRRNDLIRFTCCTKIVIESYFSEYDTSIINSYR